MFFVLSKTLDILLMPMMWIAGCLIFAYFARSQRRRKRSLLLGMGLLLVFGNAFLANEALLLWEVPAVRFNQISTPYQVGVVLTGITETGRKPQDRIYFAKGADRIVHAMQLYKQGRIRHILITGGVASLSAPTDQVTEASELVSFLKLCGVPDSAIILEEKARNTRENAVFSTQLLQEKFKGGKYLLITSGFHMRRAEACFRKAGADVRPFPADFYTHQRRFNLFDLLIPNQEGLNKWALLVHEIAGFVVYRIVGYC